MANVVPLHRLRLALFGCVTLASSVIIACFGAFIAPATTTSVTFRAANPNSSPAPHSSDVRVREPFVRSHVSCLGCHLWPGKIQFRLNFPCLAYHGMPDDLVSLRCTSLSCFCASPSFGASLVSCTPSTILSLYLKFIARLILGKSQFRLNSPCFARCRLDPTHLLALPASVVLLRESVVRGLASLLRRFHSPS